MNDQTEYEIDAAIAEHGLADDLTFPLARSAQLLAEDPEAAKAAFKAAAAAHCPHCGVKHRILTPDQCSDRQMTEKGLRVSILGRAKRRGWKVMTISKGIAAFDKAGKPIFITHASVGWPDLTLAKDGHHMIFMELKKELGEVEPAQEEWRQLLNRTGNFAIVVRPSDLREGRVNAILKDGAPLG